MSRSRLIDNFPALDTRPTPLAWPEHVPREEYGQALSFVSDHSPDFIGVGDLLSDLSGQSVLGSLGFVTCTGVVLIDTALNRYTIGHLPPSDSGLRGDNLDLRPLLDDMDSTLAIILAGSRNDLRRDVGTLARSQRPNTYLADFESGSGRWGFVLNCEKGELTLATDSTKVSQPMRRYNIPAYSS